MIVIVADDLSGACDTAVKLCGTGRSIDVLMEPLEPQLPEPRDDLALALTTNSRAMAAEEAYRRVSCVASRLRERTWTLVYKKVDSLLRGNTGMELLAFLDAMQYDLVVLAPAVPDNRRLIFHGRLVDSERSEDGVTAFERLRVDRLRPGLVPIEIIQQGAAATANAIVELYHSGCNVALLDGVNEAHLRVAAEAMRQLPLRALPAGAAGLLPYLVKSRTPMQSSPVRPCDCRTLVVAGSGHPATRHQVRRLLERERTGCVRIDVSQCLNGAGKQEIARCTKLAETTMSRGVQTLVLAVSSLFDPGEEPREASNGEVSAPLIVDAVAELTRQIMHRYHFGILFMTGGETAYRVLEELHTSSMQILYEFLPGVPVNRVCLDGRQVTVVTKSGGFGEKTTITDFIDSVQQDINTEV